MPLHNLTLLHIPDVFDFSNKIVESTVRRKNVISSSRSALLGLSPDPI